jgi:hypothetical protein
MPGQGVSGIFAFGKCYAAIVGVLAARNIPITLVLRVRWRSAYQRTRTLVGRPGSYCRTPPTSGG